jgi:hypothetical protein
MASGAAGLSITDDLLSAQQEVSHALNPLGAGAHGRADNYVRPKWRRVSSTWASAGTCCRGGLSGRWGPVSTAPRSARSGPPITRLEA